MVNKFFAWLRGHVKCDHDWEVDRVVHEQNLRAGYEHYTRVSICRLCGRYKYDELPHV